MEHIWLDDQDGLIIVGDVLDGLKHLDDNSVEAVVCDPPYDLLQASRKGSGRSNNPDSPAGRHGTKTGGFMGMAWDATGVAFKTETWEACLRVLKPGGHLVAFGGTRTHHRMWCAIEDAGFECRDMLLWLFGTGFPKSLNVSKQLDKIGETDAAKQWDGYGTSLKPSIEPILLARKPLSERTVAANVLEHGTGALNIDGTRVESERRVNAAAGNKPGGNLLNMSRVGMPQDVEGKAAEGRWPANVLLECTCDDPQPLPEEVRGRGGEPAQEKRHTAEGAMNLAAKPGARRGGGGFAHGPDCSAGMLDEQTATLKSGKAIRHRSGGNTFGGDNKKPPLVDMGYGDTGGASRFFYCAKASKKEREHGLDDLPLKQSGGMSGTYDQLLKTGSGNTRQNMVRNTHPTVKPLALMRWLVRLVTPPDGIVLDPFCGSGSTLVAAVEEGHGFVGIDLSPEYCATAQRRVQQAAGAGL